MAPFVWYCLEAAERNRMEQPRQLQRQEPAVEATNADAAKEPDLPMDADGSILQMIM